MMVLSGMSDEAQMEDNISYMAKFQPLNEDEQEIVAQAHVLQILPDEKMLGAMLFTFAALDALGRFPVGLCQISIVSPGHHPLGTAEPLQIIVDGEIVNRDRIRVSRRGNERGSVLGRNQANTKLY